jgi:putative transposase
MCRVLGIARASFYQRRHKPLSDRAIEDRRLLTLIRDSYAAGGGVYGAPRVFDDLREAGETCGKHRVARICVARKFGQYEATTRHGTLPAGRRSSI